MKLLKISGILTLAAIICADGNILLALGLLAASFVFQTIGLRRYRNGQ